MPDVEHFDLIRRFLRKAKRGVSPIGEPEPVKPLLLAIKTRPRKPRKPTGTSPSFEAESNVNPLLASQLSNWKPVQPASGKPTALPIKAKRSNVTLMDVKPNDPKPPEAEPVDPPEADLDFWQDFEGFPEG